MFFFKKKKPARTISIIPKSIATTPTGKTFCRTTAFHVQIFN
uniref:Uncharacterized protein n=1 Tax=Rhizophora mucronata TaxID=61149 RepID=A0A2P2JJ08_RHIMU